MAMYRAKQTGAHFALFDAGMQTRALDRLDMEEELRQAIENDEFRLVYQPQVRLDTGELFGVEALLRWEHPVRGMLAPDAFMDIAEETGLIVPIGNWVFEEACTQLKKWGEDFPRRRSPSMSINVSARQLADPTLVEVIERTIQWTGVSPGDLRLELTETAVVVDPDAGAETLKRLKDLGVGLTVDDFGTGYSSLSLLSRSPVDGLKIDRQFVRALTSDGQGRRVVAGLLGLAEEMGLDVVAEGVEDEHQPRELRALGCESAQGFLFERPQPAADITKLLSDAERLPLRAGRLRLASRLHLRRHEARAA
jgi:EAL domain-containing protein (putative c-di-GMP-specific phosphodiesterase class I)